MTDEQNERAARVWREATLEHWQKTNPHDYGNADTEAARNREADQAATAVIAADRARLEAENARLREALEAEDASGLIQWALQHAGASGALSEQVNPETGIHTGVSPLVWSHAELVNTILDISE